MHDTKTGVSINKLQKTQPYCVEFGNKEPVRCEWDDPELADKKNQTTFYEDDAISLPSFRACPRVRSVERARFIKFEVSILKLPLFIGFIFNAVFICIYKGYQCSHRGDLGGSVHVETAKDCQRTVSAISTADWSNSCIITARPRNTV